MMKSNHSQQTDIFVFETNIRFKKDIGTITPIITAEPRIQKWNVDQQDKGKILRVVSAGLQPSEVISLITKAGYQCEELRD